MTNKDRRLIHPGLEINDTVMSMGRFDLIPRPSPKGPEATGEIFVRASKVDLLKWVDSGVFTGEIEAATPVSFRCVHRGCKTTIYMKTVIDRPKIQFSCARQTYYSGTGWVTTGCAKTWELYQLEALTPKSFGDLFEYIVKPAGDWPNKLMTASNGVSKFTQLMQSTRDQAAEYFFDEFDGLRKNDFRKRTQ